MRRDAFLPVLVGLLMVLAAFMGWALQPERRLAGDVDALRSLEETIPVQFGEWHLESSAPPPLVPMSEDGTGRLYDEVLVRTYRSGKGERVMLSIAYGSEQRGGFKAHRPEFCYRGQGFEMGPVMDATLATPVGDISVRRVHAHSWQRDEPITYWMTLGDQVLSAGIKRHLAMFAQSLSGEIADGMLVRVSSLGRNSEVAWALQQRFVSDLVSALPADARKRLAGLPAASSQH